MSLAGVVLSDHDTLYSNRFYHSIFDTPLNLNVTFPANITEQEAANYTTRLGARLQQTVLALAKSVSALAGGGELTLLQRQSDDVQVTINRLIYCYYENATCDFARFIQTEKQWSRYLSMLDANLPNGKLSFYTGVNDASISGKYKNVKVLLF